MAELGTNKIFDEHQAASLLGLALPELRWFSRMLGLGHRLECESTTQTVFTCEELKRLSSEAAISDK